MLRSLTQFVRGALQWGAIGGYTTLQSLDASFNALTGTLPVEWTELAQLQELRLSNNTFQVRVSSSNLMISRCASCLHLYVHRNPECQHYPRASTSGIPCACYVLQGPLPPVWMDMQGGPAKMRLSSFVCAFCNLTGPMPWWGTDGSTCAPEGSTLHFFDVSHNALIGPIPAGFNSFAGLKVFNVSHNQLSGTFLDSSCSGTFAQLLHLKMSHNNFTTIPHSE